MTCILIPIIVIYTQDLFYTLVVYMITTLKELTVTSILDTSMPPPTLASLQSQYSYSGTTANKNHNLSIPVAYSHHHFIRATTMLAVFRIFCEGS